MTITVTDVTDFLSSLGTRGVEVAATLKANGVNGIKHESTMCPLANALNSRFGMIPSVGPYSIAFYSVDEREDLVVQTPHYIAEFLRDFDRGEYPELDRFARDDSN